MSGDKGVDPITSMKGLILQHPASSLSSCQMPWASNEKSQGMTYTQTHNMCQNRHFLLHLNNDGTQGSRLSPRNELLRVTARMILDITFEFSAKGIGISKYIRLSLPS